MLAKVTSLSQIALRRSSEPTENQNRQNLGFMAVLGVSPKLIGLPIVAGVHPEVEIPNKIYLF